MLPVESFPAVYCEERAAADDAKRIAKQQQEAMKKVQQVASPAQSGQQTSPQKLTQALLQRPPLSRPNSSGFMGNIFQGFVRAASTSPTASQSPTPMMGDAKGDTGVNARSLTVEMEKLRAERNRDADICAMPSW